jgi:hypothetical protein
MSLRRAAGLSAQMANPSTLRRLRRAFDGTVHLPGDTAYDTLRTPLNAALTPRPEIVAAPTSAADVQAAVIAARENDLPIAVQATGHGLHRSYVGGLLLNVSGMRSVAVDPERRIARVGAGATWGQVLAAAAPFGLAPLSGSSPSVGVTGFTLGGGVGWLSRKHGFAADSVVRAEVVTAAGQRITASADRHADLFWALRGGGGGFGLVTELEFRLHPVTRVYAGTSYFPRERAAATLAAYRDWVESAPDELSTAILLTGEALGIRLMYVGEAAEAERLIEPLRAAAGPALVDGFRTEPYAAVAIGGTAPRHLDLLPRLPDAVLDFLVEAARDEGLGISTIELRHWGGAMARPAADAGPVGHRGVPFSVIADSAEPALADTLRPHATGGSFLNFLADTTRTASAYTSGDQRRLGEVKSTYDPDDVFRLNHRIPPRRILEPHGRSALHGDRDVHARRAARLRARRGARPDAAAGPRVPRQLGRRAPA